MVAGYLEHGEQRRHRRAGQIASAVGQHNTGHGGRYVGQGDEFPYMPGPDDDDEVRRKSVGYGSGKRQITLDLHGQKQDKEAGHHYEQQVHRRGKPQAVGFLDGLNQPSGRVRRRNLESRHSRKQGIGPARSLAVNLTIGFRLMAYGYSLLGVVLTEFVALHGIGPEESRRHQQHDRHRHDKAYK